MKTALTNGLIFSGALLAALFCVEQAFEAPASPAVQTVTIIAKRMSADEKFAYDLAQAPIQTVIISAKRLSEAEKLAMDQEDANARLAAKTASRVQG